MPSHNSLAIQACHSLIEALSSDAPFLKRRMIMLSALDKACAAVGVKFENHPETLPELLGTFGADMATFNAGHFDKQLKLER